MRKEYKRKIVINEQQLLVAFSILAAIACVGGIVLGFYYKDLEVVRAMMVMLIMNVTFVSSILVLLNRPKREKAAALAIEA